jgi:uncharacterized membrane protein
MNLYRLIFDAVQERKNLIKLFSVISLGCLAIIILRLSIHADRTFVFLLWNFFLALIPLAISSLLLQVNKQHPGNYALLILGLFWMLFFPNAPYMLTDFIHITTSSDYYLSLDIVTISWFAVSSFLAALISLNDVSRILLSRYKRKRVTIMILGLSMLSGFGIYMGRYLRFNSWDVLHQPDIIFWQVTERMINPTLHPRTWMVTIGFGLLMFIVHQGIRSIGKEFREGYKVPVK